VRLLETAAELFAEQGLQASVDEVARRAGLGTGTLYRHFPTKEALIAELVRELQSDVLSDAQNALKEPDGKGLETFLYAVGVRQSSRVGCLPRFWTTPHRRKFLQAIRAAQARLLADAQEHGRVRADLTLGDVFAVLLSLRGLIETTSRLAPEAWRRYLDIVLAGMRPSAEQLAHNPMPKAVVEDLVDTLTKEPRVGRQNPEAF